MQVILKQTLYVHRKISTQWKVLLKHWKGLKLEVKSSFYLFFGFVSITTTTNRFVQQIGFWHFSIIHTVPVLFGLFHYAKLPSYKRVKWGKLAGLSPMNLIALTLRPYLTLALQAWDKDHSFLNILSTYKAVCKKTTARSGLLINVQCKKRNVWFHWPHNSCRFTLIFIYFKKNNTIVNKQFGVFYPCCPYIW